MRKMRRWTKTDLKTLRQMSRDRIPIGKAGKQLKRTEGAIRQKAFELRIGVGCNR